MVKATPYSMPTSRPNLPGAMPWSRLPPTPCLLLSCSLVTCLQPDLTSGEKQTASVDLYGRLLEAREEFLEAAIEEQEVEEEEQEGDEEKLES